MINAESGDLQSSALTHRCHIGPTDASLCVACTQATADCSFAVVSAIFSALRRNVEIDAKDMCLDFADFVFLGAKRELVLARVSATLVRQELAMSRQCFAMVSCRSANPATDLLNMISATLPSRQVV